MMELAEAWIEHGSVDRDAAFEVEHGDGPARLRCGGFGAFDFGARDSTLRSGRARARARLGEMCCRSGIAYRRGAVILLV